MSYIKIWAATVLSFSVALSLTSTETFGGSAAVGGARASVSRHSNIHPSAARSIRHHRGHYRGAPWPAAGSIFYEPQNGQAEIDDTEPTAGNVEHYTCTLDIPWDWPHRCPNLDRSTSDEASDPIVRPNVMPSVPGCPAQTVRVQMSDGKERTVTIVRCP